MECFTETLGFTVYNHTYTDPELNFTITEYDDNATIRYTEDPAFLFYKSYENWVCRHSKGYKAYVVDKLLRTVCFPEILNKVSSDEEKRIWEDLQQ